MTIQSEGAHHALNEELSKRAQAAVKPESCWRNALTAEPGMMRDRTEHSTIMSVLNRIAYFQGRRDEAANQELARDLGIDHHGRCGHSGAGQARCHER